MRQVAQDEADRWTELEQLALALLDDLALLEQQLLGGAGQGRPRRLGEYPPRRRIPGRAGSADYNKL